MLALGAGAWLRFHALGDLPAGIYHDEAFYGLDALQVLTGQSLPVFFPANNGREPLYIYLLSLSIGVLGRTPFGLRFAAAAVGTVTIAATYLLGRALFNRRVGLLAMGVCAVSFWPVALSRVSFRAGALPLFLGLAIALGWLGVQRRNVWLAALGGVAYGLAFNTYTASRLTPLAFLLFGVAVALFAWRRKQFRLRAPVTLIRAIIAFLAAGALIAAPLALYAIQHPAQVFARENQVSIFAAQAENPAIVLLRHIGLGLGMFGLWGDDIARHNLPGRPVFDAWTFAFFLAGLLALMWRIRLRQAGLASALVLVWLAVMLLPTVLAEDTPHFLRATGQLPVLWLVPAVGLEFALQGAGRLRPGLAPVSGLAAVLAIGASGLVTAFDYFGNYVHLPNTRYYFESAATELALEINERPTFASRIDPRLWHNFASLRFLVAESAGPAAPGQVLLAVWPYEPAEVRAQVLALPGGSLISAWRGPEARGDLEIEPYSLYTLYLTEPAAPEPVMARFGESVQLRHTHVSEQAGFWHIRLGWSVAQSARIDYRIFVHILAGGAIVSQRDGEPLGGLYHFTWLKPGDILNDTYVLPIGEAVRVGLYAPDGTPVGEPVIVK